MEIIYLQHNLLTNITQDAFTRYVDLLQLNFQWTNRNHLLAAQPSHQHHARCLYKVCRPPSIRLTRCFLTSNRQMDIIYLQHNLLTNITQDAYTRYVDLLPLDFQWTNRNHLLAAQPSH
jgi:hypothetical protein